ncbi:MAG: hypothetical protein HY815_34170, partial [Candidatus Riflebacteria bacterium]|nr:hypothetical protein [Candidatus Riflebacteria bacterium]
LPSLRTWVGDAQALAAKAQDRADAFKLVVLLLAIRGGLSDLEARFQN